MFCISGYDLILLYRNNSALVMMRK